MDGIDEFTQTKRPKTLVWGIMLVVISLCVSIAHTVLMTSNATMSNTPITLQSWFLPTTIGLHSVIVVLLLWGVAIGWRWVLYLYAVLYLAAIDLVAMHPLLLTVGTSIYLVLQLIAFILFFSKPSRAWFHARHSLRQDVLR